MVAYLTPPPEVRVLCLDKLGPLSVKTYPGETWQAGPYRATFEPDYGRRGSPWVHGAFEPATGQATFVLSPRRDGASHLQLLSHVLTPFPAERWLLIEDNLSTHPCRDVQTTLVAWPEIQVQFLPKYAPWLNLIEPWWKQLLALALKGCCFATLDELTDALILALDYWNAHKHPYTWKQQPQRQPLLPLGGFGSSLILSSAT